MNTTIAAPESRRAGPIFDEQNPAVKKMIAHVIAVCRDKGRKIGICGQAPSDHPDFSRNFWLKKRSTAFH